ncbi:glycosyltransferase family 39 protein [Streptomyces himalayensis]|uniref:Glycosyltransferase family 39 protein n=1 Tax=Streptomyces himalayensis subsp. himalayensis TaxID=2756131 RepID=A0A7W0IBB9_9ACTN|nr:glycosyltransferase family 39 protein [Streptomyces himalayensis]MBA2949026.1 glycosyltransferase family 39 protein [Streptomyces himalayensis subsp. himalayensis]
MLPGSRHRRPAPPSAAGLRARLRRSLRRAAPALLAYAGVRATGIVLLTVWARGLGQDVWPMLASDWDSVWYLGIADHGYERELGTEYDANNLAFFPLYPLLVKGVAALTPGPRASVGLIIAVLSSFVAAWGIFEVGNRLHGSRVGVLLTVAWAALPVGLVQWMGYTESLFTAFVAWSLYAVLTGRWVWAGSLAALSGLTRPTGIALAAAVSLSALFALRPRFSARVLAGAVLAPLGWLAYVGWVGVRLGRWDGYFAVQRLWHNEWDGGIETLGRMRRIFVYDSTPELFLVMVSLTLIASVVLFTLSVRDRQPLPLLIFTGVLLVIVLGSGGVYFPRARFLLPGFPLLLPLALAVARASRRRAAAALVCAVLGSAYWGAYMTLVWPSAP